MDYVEQLEAQAAEKRKSLKNCKHENAKELNHHGRIINIYCPTCGSHKYLNFSFDRSIWDTPQEDDLYIDQAEWVDKKTWESWIEGEIEELPRKKPLIRVGS
jgi:hypothetical protein